MSYIIGISGGSGSGKTYLLRKLREKYGEEQLCIISQDEYYKPQHLQQKDSNGIENYDLPESIDLDHFTRDLQQLRAGKEVSKEEYTFNNPLLKPHTILYKPAPVIIAEGIFIFYPPAIAQMLHMKIFVEAKEDTKLSRRLVRDKEERGYDESDVLYRYKHHIDTCYKQYIEPYRAGADLILHNNEHTEESFLALLSGIEQYLKN